MITRSQTQQGKDENQCPNNSIIPNKSSLKSPLKRSSSTRSKKRISSAQKKQQQWPSVKQLREHYETLPSSTSSNNSVEDGVDGVRRRRSSYVSRSSSSSSAYRRQSESSIISRYVQQDDVVVVGSKHEMRLKLRRVSDHVHTTTTLPTLSTTLSAPLTDKGSMQDQSHDEGAAATSTAAEVSSGCSTNEEEEEVVAAATEEANGSMIKEESEDEILESTMAQPKLTVLSPPTPSYSDNDTKEVMVKSMPKDDVSQFEGCRLKSNQTVADDEGVDDDDEVEEEEAVVIKEKESNFIQLQEEPAEDTMTKLEVEPTMVQPKLTVLAPSTPSHSDDGIREERFVASMPKDDVIQFEGCRLKSNQTVADDEGMIDDDDDEVEEEAVVIEEKEMSCIQLQEEPAEETMKNLCSSNCKEEIIPTVSNVKEMVVDSMPSQFEGCRFKPHQTLADKGIVDDEVEEEEAVAIEEKETSSIQLQEEPTEDTMKNLCSSNCKGEIVPTVSNLKETALLVKSECSKTSSTGAKDIFSWLSHLALLGLTLFGMHHRYAQTQAISSQGPIEDISSPPLQQILHVGLVFALFAKAAWKSTTAAVDKESGMQRAVCFMRHLMIWTVTIPLFQECSFGAESMCSLPAKMSSQLGLTSSAGVCIPSYSLFDVAATNSYHALLSLLKSMIKGKLLNQVYKEMQRALFNPFKFHARVQKALVILKWAKFIGPLIGTCNKFRGNLLDMARKRRQHRVSKAALKRWYDVIDALSKKSKSEQAVVQLQKAFRERQVEKTKKRQLLMANRRWVRSKLEEEERLTRTKLELIELRDIDRQQRRQVSFEERRGIVLHKHSARKLMKRLLLNPKKYFSVVWKYLAVSCVALEIMTILFAPVLSGDVKKMPLDQFIVKVLLGSRPQCNKTTRDAPSLFVPSIGSIRDITCSVSKMRQTWFVTAHVIATMLVPVVKCICFLDVFITFFTGELSNTGTLEPKPFFQRWILPGPVLQLIVNPTMASIKAAVWNAFGASIKIGPGLCLHCFLACWVFAKYLYDSLFDSILDVVEKIVEFNTQTKGQDHDEALHWT
eukprot:scaffold2351_cov84-Skeletonema_dohrnii-CCMP3373.AAC.9